MSKKPLAPAPKKKQSRVFRRCRLFLKAIRTWVLSLKWTGLKKIRHTKGSFEFQIVAPIIPVYATLHAFIFKTYGVSLPIPLDLTVLYFSSLFFVLGTQMFDLCCPEIIKNNDSRFAYIKSAIDYDRLVAAYKVDHDAIVGKAPASASDLSAIVAKAAKAVAEEGAIKVIEAFWNGENEDRRPLMYLTYVFFVISFLGAMYLTFYDAPKNVIEALEKNRSSQTSILPGAGAAKFPALTHSEQSR